MNEFDEFEGELDDGLLEQIDAIEAHHMHVPPARMESVAELDDEFADPSLEALMMNEMDATQGSESPALQLRGASDPPSTSSLTTTPPLPHGCSQAPLRHQQTQFQSCTPLIQQGLWGRIPSLQSTSQRTSSSSPSATCSPCTRPSTTPPLSCSQINSSEGQVSLAPRFSFGRTSEKLWDHRIFLQQRNRVVKRPIGDMESDNDVDPIYQNEPRPMKLALDVEQAKTWIYPTNKPLRTYQLNIVKKALFDNVLVALPTGLGKTFIAAVVILNMFRWFPQGKIIFVAPTRPLVAQQQQACHSICGLPWDTAIELTGSKKRTLRDDEWHAKRIFYMTPQTFENDLLSSTCDPSDVICVVVDEAHRATGNYAYCKVMRHLMYYNPHFRVLALTATPGNRPERVQEVVTNLHISRIEIRTEDALDIQPYLHRKREDVVHVPLSETHAHLRSTWATLMRPHYEALEKHGLLHVNDPADVRAFTVRSIAAQPHGRAILQSKPFLYGAIQKLANMAQNMQYLTELSVRLFCDRAIDMFTSTPSKNRHERMQGNASAKNSTSINELLTYIQQVRDDSGLIVHPKMKRLVEILQSHFAREFTRTSRAIVFCTFREVVHEIVELLNQIDLRATPFIGQASDSKGHRGLSQKQQEQVVRAFKDGHVQVLVATSIGEEGLDIGEVDLIVCYDAVRDSVRGLQRIGRTGRMRDGRVVVMTTAEREESNWNQSKASYKNIQNLVRHANTIELYTDVPRLVPSSLQPEPVMCEVEQPPQEPEQLRLSHPKRDAKQSRPPRKPRGQPVPNGERSRFCSAAELHRRYDEHREGEPTSLLTRPAMPMLAPPHASLEASSSSASAAASSVSRSQLLMRSSSLSGTANLSDDSDDAELSRSSQNIIPSTSASSPHLTRFAPHPLMAELAASTKSEEEAPLFLLSSQPTSEPSPSRLPAMHTKIEQNCGLGEPVKRRCQPEARVHQQPQPQPKYEQHQQCQPPRRQFPVDSPHKRRRKSDRPLRRLHASSWVLDEAERETDSEAHGESDEDDDGPSTSEENDDDRAAVGDFEPTQRTGYQQQAVYLQSMLSQQAPTPFRRRDRLVELLEKRYVTQPSSELEASSQHVDEYSQDSFVVDDDAISWASSTNESIESMYHN